MADTIGAKLQLEGETQFKNAIKDIDANLKALSSALELTSVQFEGQEDSIEAVTAKQKGLQAIYDQQVQKVDQLRAALEKSITQYGAADAKTLSWETKLNNASIALEKTRQAISKNEDALSEMEKQLDATGNQTDKFKKNVDSINKETKGLGDTLNILGQKFGVSLPEEITNTINRLGSVNTKTIAVAGGIALLVASIAKAEQALIDMTKQSAAYVDSINTMAVVTNISAESLQEYTYAAELLDVSVEKITQSQLEVTKSMSDAKNGTEERIQAFNRLGVAYQNADGSLRNSEEVFWEVIDALGQMTNETERDSVAMKILSESATELNPLIEAGSEKMKEYAAEAHEVGYVLDEEALSSLQNVDDAMQRFEKTTEAAKNQLSAEFAPYLTDSTEKLTAFVTDLGEAMENSGIVDAFGMLLQTVVDILIPTEELSEERIPRLTEALKPLSMGLALIADTMTVIAGLIEMIWGIVPFNWGSGHFTSGIDNIKTGMGWNTSNGKPSAQYRIEHQDALNVSQYNEELGGWVGNANLSDLNTMTGTVNGNVTTLVWENGKWVPANASGNVNWRGGVTWVGENGPEKVYLPQGSQILNAQDSRNEGNTIIYVTIDAKNVKEFNDIVKIAQEARMKTRKNLG